MMKEGLTIGIQIAVASLILTLCIVFIPLLFIWCVNTLFNCGIEYSMLNWFAALVLMAITGGSSRAGSSK